jgi:hypothetical protein
MAARVENKHNLLEALQIWQDLLRKVKDVQKEILVFAVENEMPGVRIDWNVLQMAAEGTYRMPKRVREQMEENRTKRESY